MLAGQKKTTPYIDEHINVTVDHQTRAAFKQFANEELEGNLSLAFRRLVRKAIEAGIIQVPETIQA